MAERDDPRAGAALFDFVELFLRERDAGRARALEGYQALWPEHAEAIEREWRALLAPPEPAQAAEGRVGPWRLVRELGRGGQGSVWLAEDTRIARRAALKLLPESFAQFSGDRRARLRREAEALARLDHPGLCPILEAEIEGERPYIAMRLIDGETLAARLSRGPDAHGAPTLPPRTRAELEACLAFFEQAARALHVAHEAGLLHRDVKPGNVMVTPDGRAVIVDFGQAREVDGADVLTLTGDLFGTPAYLSPEQVRGRSRALDRRTDVWSLGATLYECLTGRRPFDGASVTELLLAIVQASLPSAREHNPLLPSAVEVVLETALERDLSRRYATALDLAEDLARARTGASLRARPAGAALRLARWSRRHPALALGLSLLVCGLTIGWLWTAHLLRREQRANTWALGSHLAKRAQALIAEDPAAALALGIEAVEKAPNYETRAALLSALDACDLRSLLEGSPGRRLFDLEVDPTGTRVACAFDDGALRVFDVRDGRKRHEFALGTAPLRALRFAPDGAACLVGGDDGVLHRVTFDGAPAVRLAELEGALLDLALAPDGTRLAVCTDRAPPRLLDASDGAVLAVCQASADTFDALEWSPDGERLLLFTRRRQVEGERGWKTALLLDARDGRLLRELDGHTAPIAHAAFDAAGRLLVTVGLDGIANVVRAADGERVLSLPRAEGALFAAAFSPDGRYLAVGGEGPHPLRLAALADGSVRVPGAPPAAAVLHVAFAPDGATLACAGDDNSTRLFALDDLAQRARFSGFLQPLASRWTPDGRSLVSQGRGNTAAVWIAGGRDDVYALVGHGAQVVDAEFSPDGTRAATASLDGSARLWCTARDGSERAGSCLAVLRDGDEPVRGARFDGAGEVLWTWGDGARVGLWNARDGAPRGSIGPLEARVLDFDVSPAGGAAAALVATGAVLRLDGRARTALELPPLRGATCLRFARDGSRLAVGRADGSVLVLGPDGAAPLACAGAPRARPIVEIAFAHDGSELAWVDTEGTVAFARLDGGAARAPVVAFPPLALDWSRDGAHLLVVGSRGRGAIRIQDLSSNTQERLEAFHAGDLTGGEFSPDGALVLSSSQDGTVYVRRASGGVPEALLQGHAAAVLRARFSRDGGPLRVISASADGTARVTPVDPLPSARARKPRELQEWEYHREKRLAEPLDYVR
jgi:WD40 repeat protein